MSSDLASLKHSLYALLRAAELLCSLSPAKRALAPVPVAQPPDFHTSTPARTRNPRQSFSFSAAPSHEGSSDPASPYHPRHPDAPSLHTPPVEVLRQEAEWEAQDADHLAMAKTLLDAKEYVRVVHWLEPCRSSKAAFLRTYSQYLVGLLPSLNSLELSAAPTSRRVRRRPSENGTN